MKQVLFYLCLVISTLSIEKSLASQYICESTTNSEEVQLPDTSWENFVDVSWYNNTQASFVISTAEQLAGLAKLVKEGNDFDNKTIELTEDIDLKEHLWEPIGFSYRKPFKGIFDANNHVISNVFIKLTQDYLGLFGWVQEAQLKNIRLNKVIIRAKRSTKVGSLVGEANKNSVIENCHARAIDISTEKEENILGSGANIGGMCGSVSLESNITNCSVGGKVSGYNQVGGFIGSPYDKVNVTNCYAIAKVSGNFYVGGFVGFSTFTIPSMPGRDIVIQDCYAIAEVTATEGGAGGFYGKVDFGKVKNCYAASTVSAPDEVGGFAGVSNVFIPDNAYYDITKSGNVPAIGTEIITLAPSHEIYSKTSEEMKSENFANQLNDGGNVWKYDASINEGYPYLDAVLAIDTIQKEALEVHFYPNPVRDNLYIQSQYYFTNFKVYNLNAKLVKSGEIGNNQELNLSDLSSGIYIMELITSTKSSIKIKVLKD